MMMMMMMIVIIIKAVHVRFKNKSDTSNNRGNWKHFIITQTVPEQHTGKSQNQGATKHSHIGHCTYTSERTNVERYKTCLTCEITCSIQSCPRIHWFSIRGLRQAKKINWKLKKYTIYKFQNAHQTRMFRNMVNSSSPNAPSTWLIFLFSRTHASPQNLPPFCF
jgi:hypothetical protein